MVHAGGMKRACEWARLGLALCLTLQASCATPRVGSAGRGPPKVVKTSWLSDDRLRLSFEPVAAPAELEVLSREEARAIVSAFGESLLEESPKIRIISPALPGSRKAGRPAVWEQRASEEFQSRFGGTLLPLPATWEESRLFRALKLSPRYMGMGVREAAQELFQSPAFVASVALSILVYFAAWAAPEPLFSKAFAASVTLALALVVGVVELSLLARACVRLYHEAEAARTEAELEAASARFGKAVGGVWLRVMVMVASFGVGKALPGAPPGGLGAVLGPPRYAVEGGVAVGAAASVRVVSEGSLIVSGVAVGEVATRLCGGLAMCATMVGASGGGKLSTRYGPPHTRENPAHNEAIERELAAREAAGHTGLRKNKEQLNAQGRAVRTEKPVKGHRFRRPDASSLRPDGVRHNTNYVSNPRDLQRELDAFEAMVQADERAIHELYQLDGTLLRRYVPPGVSYP